MPQASWSAFNQAVCALRFFYGVTLGRPGVVAMIPFAKRPKILPAVVVLAPTARRLTTRLSKPLSST